MNTPQGHILVVDDDDGILDLLTLILEEDGYQVLTAPNGTVALQLVEQRPPHLILVDLRMPVMDGWTFARRYRQLPGPHAPLVIMTAAEEASRRTAELRADGFLGKPFDKGELLAVVAGHAAGHHQGRHAGRAEAIRWPQRAPVTPAVAGGIGTSIGAWWGQG